MLLRKFFVKKFPLIFLKFLYKRTYGFPLDISNPVTFYDKLIWLNFNKPNPLKGRCADKLAVRDYLMELGLGNHLNDLLGVYQSVNEINFTNLPDSFVLKCTHGSGMNIICRDKASFNYRKSLKILNKWLKLDYSEMYGEFHYKSIPPRIICEKHLGNCIREYKVYCFHGAPKYILICEGRFCGPIKWYLYDFDWNYTRCLKNHLPDPQLTRPENLNEMYGFCERLSSEFDFVRVDFYNINSKILFGELTFYPSAFMDSETTEEINIELGKLLNIQ
jgi:hypothetical protein